MKKTILLFVAAIFSLISFNVSADVVSQEVAKKTADNLLSLDSEWHGLEDATMRLVERDGVPAYYIIEYNAGGWAIVSAQTTATPLIGYNPTGTYAAPEPMQHMLNISAQKIVERASDDLAVEHVGWRRAMQRKPAADPVSVPDIAPIIPVNLNQSDPYNRYCPTIEGRKALVGCVAVATTQAMAVHSFPDQGQGKHTYSDANTGSHTVDFDNEAPYDWDAIIAGDGDEAARILYHVGVAVNMMYGLQFSGAFTDDAYKALYRNFRYDKEKLQLTYRFEHDDNEWLEMLLNELILGRAIIYQGAMNSEGEGGHCWNLDGWKQATQKVHCNWGWGGYGDGYFSLDDMSDDFQGIDLNYHHGAILGVGTPTTAPYGIKISRNKFEEGTAAGVALADVTVSCEDETAEIGYETFGPKNVRGEHTTSPYQVQDGKLVATKAVANTNAFKYLKMKVTNLSTGETFEKEFSFTITQGNGAVDAALSDAVQVYPIVATDVLTVETPTAGGEYAIYTMTGAQVAAGEIAGYKTEINLSHLAVGNYILRYVHSDGVGVKTFIKR